MSIGDNAGNVVAPLVVRPVNHHDNLLFNESFFGLMDAAYLLELDVDGSYLTLDSGFDCDANKVSITGQGLVPVIHPNVRNLKDPEKIDALWERFEPYRDIYKERYKIERSFAWEDVYRKLVIRYERLPCIHLGFKYVAFSLVNLRWFIGKRQGKP